MRPHTFKSRPGSRAYTKASTLAEADDHSETSNSSTQQGSILSRLRHWRTEEHVQPRSSEMIPPAAPSPPGRRWSLPGFRGARRHGDTVPATPAPSVPRAFVPLQPSTVQRHTLFAPQASPTPTRGKVRPLDTLMTRSRSGEDASNDSPSRASSDGAVPAPLNALPRVPVRRIPRQSVSSADPAAADAVRSDPDALAARLEQRIKTLSYLYRVVSGDEAYLYRTTLSAAAYRAVNTAEQLDTWSLTNVRLGMALGALLELDSPVAVRCKVSSAIASDALDTEIHLPFAVDVVLTLQTVLHVLDELYRKLLSWTPDADNETCTHVAVTDDKLKIVIQQTAMALANIARGVCAAELESWDRAVQSNAIVWECMSPSSVADAVGAALLPRRPSPPPHRRSLPMPFRRHPPPTAPVALFSRRDGGRALRATRSAAPLRP